MSIRIDAMGTVRVGKAPTTKYVIRYQSVRTGEVATEIKKDTLKRLSAYLFMMSLNYNFQGHGTIFRAEIWRTYKNQSKRVHTCEGGVQ